MLIEAPKDFAKGELLRISCQSPEMLAYRYLLLPLTWSKFVSLLSQQNALVEYYDEYLSTRPMQQASGGRHNLVKLFEFRFDNSENRTDEENRFLFSTLTSASTGDESVTQIVVCWESAIHEMVTKVKTDTWWKLVGISATFFLAVERLYHLHKRLIS